MSSPTSVKFNSVFIRAGAGAGKTTQLVSTFFQFVDNYRKDHSTTWPKVVITTFTKKATQELKERLLLYAFKNNRLDYIPYINKKSKVHISTIHGVLSLFLNKYIDYLDFNSEIKVVTDFQLLKTNKRILKKILNDRPEWLFLLETFSVKNLISHLDEGSQFLAEYADKVKVKSQAEIVIDLKNNLQKALIDFEVIIKELQATDKTQWHNYAAFITGFKNALAKELAQAEFQGISKELYYAYEERPSKPSYLRKNPPFSEEINSLIDGYLSSKADFLSITDTESFMADHENLNVQFFELLKCYRSEVFKYKQNTGYIPVSDLETLTLQLIQKHPEAAQNFANQYDFFMIDEYQDTSPLQIHIIDQFAAEKAQFIVGDPQQSIYLFRGARSEVFKNKQAVAEKSQFTIKELKTNYRSAPQLMTFMNDTLKVFSSQFTSLDPRPLKAEEKIPEVSSSDPVAYFIKTEDEYAAIAQQIVDFYNKGIAFSDMCVLFSKNKDVLDFSRYALQYKIPAQPQIAAGYDRKREINDLIFFLKFLVNPHDSENLVGLLRSPWFNATDEQIMQIRQSEHKNNSFWVQLKSTIGAVSTAASSANTTAIINSVSIASSVANDESTLALKKDYQRLLGFIMKYESEGVLESLNDFLFKTDFLEASYYLDNSGQREANIWKFLVDLKENSVKADFVLNEYLSEQFVALQADMTSNLSEGIPLQSGDRVSVMTIHSSKGLEFPHVIIGGMSQPYRFRPDYAFVKDEESKAISLSLYNEDEAKFQNTNWAKSVLKKFSEREVQEFERLFYVGLTRAEKTVSLVAEERKSLEGSWQKKINWPEEGEHVFEGYKVSSFKFDGEPHKIERSFTVSESVRPFYFQSALNLEAADAKASVSSEVVSVTDIIEGHPAEKSAVVNVKKSDDPISTVSVDFSSQVKNLTTTLYKAAKGTRLHQFFEALKYNDKKHLEQFLTVEESKALSYLYDQKQIPFAQILKQGFAEWGFGVQTSLGFIQGQIDLWTTIGDTVYILDYKTGSTFYKDKAFKQLSLYAACLKQMGFLNDVSQVKLVALYPFDQTLFIQDISISEVEFKPET